MAEALQKIDASYIEALTVPVAKLESYVTKEKQQMMVGAYFFDFCYAAAFANKSQAAAYLRAVGELIENKLHYSLKSEHDEAGQTMIDEKSVPDLTGEELRQIVRNQKLLPTATPDLVVNAIIGSLTEATYVISELAAQSGYNPDFLKVVSDQKKRVDLTIRAMKLFEGSIPNVAQYLVKIAPIQAIFNAGAITDKAQLDAIRQVITPLRKELIE